MQIRIVNVGNTETKQGKKAAYSVFELVFSVDGNERKRKIMSFDKDTYKVLKAAVPGEVYDVTVKQNGEYWDWVSVTKVSDGSAAPAAAASGTRAGGNWETADERAKKQVYIVRQSSIANAVAYHNSQEAQVTVQEVIATARQFEAYVFGQDEEPFIGDEDVVM